MISNQDKGNRIKISGAEILSHSQVLGQKYNYVIKS